MINTKKTTSRYIINCKNRNKDKILKAAGENRHIKKLRMMEDFSSETMLVRK